MKQMLHATRLFDDPIIIYCKRWSLFDVECGLPEEPMHPIVKILSSKDVVWLIQAPWLAEDEWSAKIYRRTFNAIKSVAPKHRIIFLANTFGEKAHFDRLKLESFVANQNQFVDRSLFKPTETQENRPFDAVYNARFMTYKRHDLAIKIDRLALIGYSFDTPDYHRIVDQLSGAHLANIKEGQLRLLTEMEVNHVLNSSSCGLCLSKVEGAMTAAVEYLLSGIPVVTTVNRGGRDFFLDGRFARWVSDSASEVSREVSNFVLERIPPEYIRAETIKKIDVANDAFLDNLSSIISISRDSLSREYQKRFNHRLAMPKHFSKFM